MISLLLPKRAVLALVTLAALIPLLSQTTEQDHQNMMDQLWIKALRPGPSGNEKEANHANYDEANANPFGHLPDALTLKNGHKVTSAEQWWNERRPSDCGRLRARSCGPHSVQLTES